MPRHFITRTDIDAIADAGQDELVIDDLTTVTDIGREHARERGVRLVREPRPPTAAPQADPGPQDVHAVVRTEVISRLGDTPADLDDTIRTVIARTT